LVAGVEGALIASMTQAVIQAAEKVSDRQSQQLKALGKALAADVIPPDRRQKAHETIGKAAQLSTQQGYTHRKHKRNTPSTRITANDDKNRRFAGGALLRAIQAKDFFRATSNGLEFINVTRLDTEAKQWKRLNFGAGGKAGASPGRSEVRWSGMVVAQLGLAPDPRPAFKIPKGYWINGNDFYPRGEAPKGSTKGARRQGAKITEGIVASNFLDAGVRRIANEFPLEYQRMYAELVAKFGRERLSEVLQVKAPPVRPQRIQVKNTRALL
jgi:hypothetical protein